MSVSTPREFYFEIMVKGVKTSTKSTDTIEKREERKEVLRATVEKAIAPKVDRKFASSQFIGSVEKSTGMEAVYVTTIYPSGLYHCECGAFKRTGAQRQDRPCKHASALAKIAYLEMR